MSENLPSELTLETVLNQIASGAYPSEIAEASKVPVMQVYELMEKNPNQVKLAEKAQTRVLQEKMLIKLRRLAMDGVSEVRPGKDGKEYTVQKEFPSLFKMYARFLMPHEFGTGPQKGPPAGELNDAIDAVDGEVV